MLLIVFWVGSMNYIEIMVQFGYNTYAVFFSGNGEKYYV